MNVSDYLNRGEFSNVQTSVNFDADFTSWGKLNDDTIQTNSGKSLDDCLMEVGAYFNPFVVTPGYDNPVTGQRVNDEDNRYILNQFGDKIGLVGKNFNPMPHHETLREGFGELTQKGGIATKVINFDGGRKILVTFFTGIRTIADRLHHKYIGMYNALDGSTSANFGGLDYCVVCANTFAASRATIKESGFKAKHTVNMGNKLAQIRKQLGIIEATMEDYYTMLDKFSTVKVENKTAVELAYYLLPDGNSDKRENNGPANRRGDLLGAVAKSQEERNTSELTIYDIMQGVTRYNTYRQQNRNSVEQMEYVTEKIGADFADKGYNWLVNYVNSK